MLAEIRNDDAFVSLSNSSQNPFENTEDIIIPDSNLSDGLTNEILDEIENLVDDHEFFPETDINESPKQRSISKRKLNHTLSKKNKTKLVNMNSFWLCYNK